MATAVQRRRGTTAQHAAFTGLLGEVTVNTSTRALHVHDAVIPGGIPTTGGLFHGIGYGMRAGSNTHAAANRTALIAIFAAITAAGAGTVLLPDGDFYINCTSTGGYITVPSNTTIQMGKKTRLIAYNTDAATHSIFRLANVSNIQIQGGELVGNKAGSYGTGDGIVLTGTTNAVTIRDVVITSFSEDGIYFNCTGNVHCFNMLCTDNKRSGCSIVSGATLGFHACRFTSNGGAAPQTGVNIESQAATDVTDVLFSVCEFISNTGTGLYIHKGSGAGIPNRINVFGCTFRSNGGDAVNTNSGWSNLKVHDCTFSGNSASETLAISEGTIFSLRGNRIIGGAGKGLTMYRCNQGIVDANRISDTGDSAIAMVDDSTTVPCHTITISNNHIYNSGEKAIDARGNQINLENNVVDVCQKNGLGVSGANCRIIGNSVFQCGQASNSWTGISDGGFGNIVANNIVRKGRHSCTGTAAAGGATSITLDAFTPALDSVLVGYAVKIISGTGVANEQRTISAWNGTTKVATVSLAWTTNPDNTTVYEVLPIGTGFYALFGLRMFSSKSLAHGNNVALSGTTNNFLDSGTGNTVADQITA